MSDLFDDFINIFSPFRKTPVLYKSNWLTQSSLLRINKLDRHNYLGKLGLKHVDLLNLSGGIPSESITVTELNITITSGHIIKTNIHYKSKGKRIAEVTRTFDFNEKLINNQALIVYKPRERISTNIFLNQVNTARKFKFSLISTSAAGGTDYDEDNPDKKYQGYIHWGQYGYYMDNPHQTKFDEWIVKFDRKEKNLWQLQEKKDGNELWKKHGWSWDGYFDLTENSKSIKRLNKFLAVRNINLPANTDFH